MCSIILIPWIYHTFRTIREFYMWYHANVSQENLLVHSYLLIRAKMLIYLLSTKIQRYVVKNYFVL